MEFTYKEIKESYLEIKAFLESWTNEKIILSTRIEEDLNFQGADNIFLLEEFIEKYNLDFTDFDYDKHFMSEVLTLKQLFLIPLFPFFIIIQLLAYYFPNLESLSMIYFQKPKADLTFGDLVASKLKGEFCLKTDANIQLKKEK
jgi:hypothetical protein